MAKASWLEIGHSRDSLVYRAGIYRWTVSSRTYVGKATNLHSRLKEYLNNVRKIENGLPYRKGNADGFRAIHHALADAKERGLPMKWEVLEFLPKGGVLLEGERRWIAKLRPDLNGPQNLIAEKSDDR
ncbi:MAG: GIY-YIG nuclease family protein [Pseudorhodobacter sp.]